MKKHLLAIIPVIFLITACATPIPISTVTPFPSITPSIIPSPIIIPTATAIPLNVSPEILAVLKSESALNPDGSLNTNMRYVEYGKEIKFSLESIQIITFHDSAIKEAISIKDIEGNRYFWNKRIKAWVPEFGTNLDYKNPEISPYVPIEAYYDGSSTLEDLIYIAEHPDLIARDASHPYYRITLFGNDQAIIGYQIALTGPNQYLLVNENTTKLQYTQDKPFAYFGAQQTKDANGNVIYVIKKANHNPTAEYPDWILPTNNGFDKATYEDWFQYPLILKYLTNAPSMTGEFVPLFPSPTSQFQEANPNRFFYETQRANPSVFGLQDPKTINIFDAQIQADLNTLYLLIGKPFDATTNPGSFLIPSLPSELSNMILYTSVQQFK